MQLKQFLKEQNQLTENRGRVLLVSEGTLKVNNIIETNLNRILKDGDVVTIGKVRMIYAQASSTNRD